MSEMQSKNIKTDNTNEETVNNNIKGVENESEKINNLKKYIQTKELEGGKVFSTFNAGWAVPIHFKTITAGEYISHIDFKNITRIKTPLVPSFDNMNLVLTVGFVPNSYMIDDYDTLKTQSETLERMIGTINNNRKAGILPTITSAQLYSTATTPKTLDYKQTIHSKYIPNWINESSTVKPISVLPLRAYKAIYNWFIRNKAYMRAYTELKTNTSQLLEYQLANTTENFIGRPSTLPNYYSNIRPNIMQKYIMRSNGLNAINDMIIYQNNTMGLKNVIQGNELRSSNIPASPTREIANANAEDNDAIANHLDWQKQYAELKRRVESSEKNPNEIIAELGATYEVKTDRPQLLSRQIYPLSYQQATQTAPTQDDSPLGETGSFSYTENSNYLLANRQFTQDGILVIIASVQSDNCFENAMHRTFFTQNIVDLYNPELAEQTYDIMYSEEVDGGVGVPTRTLSLGFKPKYSEYDTVANIVQGDMRTLTLTDGTNTSHSESYWHNMNSPTNLTTPTQPTPDYIVTDMTDYIIERNNAIGITPLFDQIRTAFKFTYHCALPKKDVKINEYAKVERN